MDPNRDLAETLWKHFGSNYLVWTDLSHVHEVRYGVLVLTCLLAVVFEDEVCEGFSEVHLFRLLQAEWDHRHHAVFAVKNKINKS